jgi:hypothetical protein
VSPAADTMLLRMAGAPALRPPMTTTTSGAFLGWARAGCGGGAAVAGCSQ